MVNSGQIRFELTESLKGFTTLKRAIPAKGWIRSIREALGMSGRQLAQRIDVKGSRIPEMERAEVHGNITLKSLRRAAQAMDCDLVYAFFPKTDLETSLRVQAEMAARKSLDAVSHSIRLEERTLTTQENEEMLTEIVKKCIQQPPRWLWDS